MTKDKIRQMLNLFGVIAMPTLAILAGLGFFGASIGEVSNRYPTYVVPAGYAFLIWNPIYALMLGYGFWQALPAQRTNQLLRRVGWFSAAAAFACALWVPVFQLNQFALSVAVILCLLISLIGVIARLYGYRASLTKPEHWLVYVNFSIFLGWITVATVANIAQTLTANGWDGWGYSAESWGIVALLLAGAIAASVIAATKGNVPYALTLVWALVAVAVNQFSGLVATSSARVGLVALVMTGVVLFTLWRSQPNTRHWPATSMANPLQD